MQGIRIAEEAEIPILRLDNLAYLPDKEILDKPKRLL
jgi:hypothetical protein